MGVSSERKLIEPVRLKEKYPSVLACGAEEKNTFCLTQGHYGFISQHIGDLKDLETLRFYENEIQRFKKLYRITPRVVACDLHPGYLSTGYAMRVSGGKALTIQHHHAHIVSCLAENGVTGKRVIGVALDGTGYGTDGKVWGGEFLLATEKGFERAGHLRYVPLPGGDAAVKEPWRMAVSYLYQAFGRDFLSLPLNFNKRIKRKKVSTLLTMIEKGINSPDTSSCGRLFDAVSSLIGICDVATYEAQAAIELEMAAEKKMRVRQSYPYQTNEENGIFVVDCVPIIQDIVKDLKKDICKTTIAAKFHRTCIDIVCQLCKQIRVRTGIDKVALSGGVFQNRLLLEGALDRLNRNKFTVYRHSKVPCNDRGISLGQAVIAGEKIKCA